MVSAYPPALTLTQILRGWIGPMAQPRSKLYSLTGYAQYLRFFSISTSHLTIRVSDNSRGCPDHQRGVYRLHPVVHGLLLVAWGYPAPLLEPRLQQLAMTLHHASASLFAWPARDYLHCLPRGLPIKRYVPPDTSWSNLAARCCRPEIETQWPSGVLHTTPLQLMALLRGGVLIPRSRSGFRQNE